jgi:hypothetical protein
VNTRCVDGYATADVVVTALQDLAEVNVDVDEQAPPLDVHEWQWGHDSFALAAGSSQWVIVPLPAPDAAAIRVWATPSDPAVDRVQLPAVTVAAPSCAGSPTAPVFTADVARCAGDDGAAITVTITDPPGGTERRPWFWLKWNDAPPDSDSGFLSNMHGDYIYPDYYPQDGGQVVMTFDDFGFTDCCGEETPGETDDVPDPFGPGDYTITPHWEVTLTASDASGRVDTIEVENVGGEPIELTVPVCGYLPTDVRVATFDVSLTGLVGGETVAGDSVTESSVPDDPQSAAVAEIIQRTRPDVLLLGGFDTDADGDAIEQFRTSYLAVAHGDAEPIDYPYWFSAPTNSTPGTVVLSRYPILDDEVRTFQNLPWSAMPDTPQNDATATTTSSDTTTTTEDLGELPLSTTSLWDVPIDVDGTTLHVLASQLASSDEDAMRNADEIRFWVDYVTGDDTSWIVDDTGSTGGLADNAAFVIVGDLGADPIDGNAVPGAIDQLLALDTVQDPEPASDGAVEATELQAGANAIQQGDPATDTADLTDDPGPGNLRTDYVLPSDCFDLVDSGVFWPTGDDPLAALLTDAGTAHHLVWADLH